MPDRPLIKWAALALAAAPVALLAVSLLIGSTPDEEEFRFAVLTTWLHVRGVIEGHYDLWTPLLGLGIPQPLTPNFFLHPLTPLLPLLGPVAWSRMLVVVHTLLGATGMWQLTKALSIRRIVRAVCVISFLFATPVQNYVLADFWPSHYLVWTSAPWMLLLAWRALGAEGRALRRTSIALGLCCGLVVANTNPGHILVYATIAIAVVVANWRRVVPRWRWLLAAAALAAAIAGPTVAQLAHERTFFAADVQRSNVPDPLPVTALWDALFNPLAPPTDWPVNEQLPFTRALFFGGPFLLLSGAGCVWFARARPDLVLAVVSSAVLLFTALLPLSMVSARYHFRDPLTLAAIAVAGLTLDKLLSIRGVRPVGAAVAVVQVVAMFASAWPTMSHTWQPDARAAQWFRGATGETATVDRLLALMPPPGRIVFSPELDREVYARERLVDGLGVNALAYRGVLVVNGWFKGISTDSISPDERLFYARIRAPLSLVTTDVDLDVLGVRYVVVTAGDAVAPRLVNRGTVRMRDGSELVIYENADAWPAGFLVDDMRAPDIPLAPGCENTRLLCHDLTALAQQRSAERMTITHRGGAIDVELTPTGRSHLLVISEMFRPDWEATVNGRSATVTPVAGALLGVELPPRTSSVRLRYRPAIVVAATAVAWIALLGGMAALIARGKRARTSVRSGC